MDPFIAQLIAQFRMFTQVLRLLFCILIAFRFVPPVFRSQASGDAFMFGAACGLGSVWQYWVFYYKLQRFRVYWRLAIGQVAAMSAIGFVMFTDEFDTWFGWGMLIVLAHYVVFAVRFVQRRKRPVSGPEIERSSQQGGS